MTPKEFNKKVKAIKQLSKDIKFKQSLGAFVRKMIYSRVKLGRGVTSDKAKPQAVRNKKLKGLSDSYIQQRKGRLKFFKGKQGQTFAVEKSSRFSFSKPKLGPLGKPSKSNLTFSGDMLEALEFKVTKSGVRVFVNNRIRKDGMTNQEVAEHVSKDRPFLNLSNVEHKRVIQFIEDEIDRRLEKAFK